MSIAKWKQLLAARVDWLTLQTIFHRLKRAESNLHPTSVAGGTGSADYELTAFPKTDARRLFLTLDCATRENKLRVFAAINDVTERKRLNKRYKKKPSN